VIKISTGPYAGGEASVVLDVLLRPNECGSTPSHGLDITNSGPFVFTPASAGVTCKTLSGSATFTPGLSAAAKNQTIAVAGVVGGCTKDAVTTGTSKASIVTKNATCSLLTKTGVKGTITETITWNTGATSKLAGSVVTGPKAGQAKLTLTVTKGLFVGLHGSQVIALIRTAPTCSNKAPLKKLIVKAVSPLVIK
jgi:hypothetical protein